MYRVSCRLQTDSERAGLCLNWILQDQVLHFLILCRWNLRAHQFLYIFWAFSCCLGGRSGKKRQCPWGRSRIRNFTTGTYVATLPSNFSSITYIIIARKFFMNTLAARYDLSCGTCAGNSALLIMGQLGLHTIFTRESQVSYLVWYCCYIVRFAEAYIALHNHD